MYDLGQVSTHGSDSTETRQNPELGWLLAIGTQVSIAYHTGDREAGKGNAGAVSRSWKSFHERQLVQTTPGSEKATPGFILFLPHGSCMTLEQLLKTFPSLKLG